MITLKDYFGPWLGHPDATSARLHNADTLLDRVNRLVDAATQDGVKLLTNPATGTNISGQLFGGFRPQSCPQGAPHSSHKQGQGIDLYDPHNELDAWLDDDRLVAFGLFREHPDATQRWCHLTTRQPGSGNRTFLP